VRSSNAADPARSTASLPAPTRTRRSRPSFSVPDLAESKAAVCATEECLVVDQLMVAQAHGWQAQDGIAEALDDVLNFIAQYVVLSDAQAVAVCLWIAHTHTFEAAEATPYLAINSAEKASGKTRLLETLELLVAKHG